MGDTLSEEKIEPFEQITHYSKPVVTKAVEAKDSRDTAKLIEALRVLSKQDPTIKVEINQETGEHLISGMGELHLEIIETKLRDEFRIADNHERADSRLPGDDREGAGGADREQEPEQAHEVLRSRSSRSRSRYWRRWTRAR